MKNTMKMMLTGLVALLACSAFTADYAILVYSGKMESSFHKQRNEGEGWRYYGESKKIYRVIEFNPEKRVYGAEKVIVYGQGTQQISDGLLYSEANKKPVGKAAVKIAYVFGSNLSSTSKTVGSGEIMRGAINLTKTIKIGTEKPESVCIELNGSAVSRSATQWIGRTITTTINKEATVAINTEGLTLDDAVAKLSKELDAQGYALTEDKSSIETAGKTDAVSLPAVTSASAKPVILVYRSYGDSYTHAKSGVYMTYTPLLYRYYNIVEFYPDTRTYGKERVIMYYSKKQTEISSYSYMEYDRDPAESGAKMRYLAGSIFSVDKTGYGDTEMMYGLVNLDKPHNIGTGTLTAICTEMKGRVIYRTANQFSTYLLSSLISYDYTRKVNSKGMSLNDAYSLISADLKKKGYE